MFYSGLFDAWNSFLLIISCQRSQIFWCYICIFWHICSFYFLFLWPLLPICNKFCNNFIKSVLPEKFNVAIISCNNNWQSKSIHYTKVMKAKPSCWWNIFFVIQFLCLSIWWNRVLLPSVWSSVLIQAKQILFEFVHKKKVAVWNVCQII